MIEFPPMPKIARLSRLCTITEKIDGTNASIYISEDLSEFLVGSRTRWITPENDNFGFARWAHTHREELMTLGPGQHFGEWWGLGIQRAYGQKEKRFSLFNTHRWSDAACARPACCSVVPVVYEGTFSSEAADAAIVDLKFNGSLAAPGFMKPEGIVLYHQAAKMLFKKTILNDEKPKGSKEE
jgi:hypothetical protein